MREFVPVTKNEEEQQPIPTEWRDTIAAIVDAFTAGDFQLQRGVPNVRPVSPETARQMRNYVDDYTMAPLAPLPSNTWRTSVCQWQVEYWDVLVDLFIEGEGASDLTLDLRVFEDGAGFAFQVCLICVH